MVPTKTSNTRRQDQQLPLIELKLIVHIRGVLGASAFSARRHFVRVISLDPALLVSPKGISGEIRVFLIEVPFGPVGLFRAVRLHKQVSQADIHRG